MGMKVKSRFNIQQEQANVNIFHTSLPYIKLVELTPAIRTSAPPPHYLMEVKE